MNHRHVRILLGKMGEGHNRALLNLAKSFREAGYEVVYTELQEPEAIVKSALEECVDHIGITTLPGAKSDALQEVLKLLEEEDAAQISVTAGGYMAPEEIARLKDFGVKEFFPKGTTFDELVEWSRSHIRPLKA